MLPREHDPGERRLVEHCLTGKTEAWEELYQRLLQRAPNAIYRARQSVKRYTPDEVAGDVWVGLQENKDQLQVFLQATKSLDAFLDSFLSSAVRRQAQREKRHWAKHTPLARIDVPDASLPEWDPEFLERLRPLLTRRENDYVAWWQQALAEGTPPCPFSKARARQLRRSIREKARKLRREDQTKENR